MSADEVAAITGAVDFGTVVVGVSAVFAAVALVLIAMKGGKMLMRAIGG